MAKAVKYDAEGKKVAAGQLLAQIDPRTLVEELEATRSQLEQARLSLSALTIRHRECLEKRKREELLYNQGLISKEGYQSTCYGEEQKRNEIERSKWQIKETEGRVRTYEKKLAETRISAPLTGTVTELFVGEGEWVVPGQPVLQLADLIHLRVETTDLNEIDAAQVQPGSEATVTFDALVDEVAVGTVKSIAPTASGGSGVNYMVVIELDDLPEALRWGMTAFVDIKVE